MSRNRHRPDERVDASTAAAYAKAGNTYPVGAPLSAAEVAELRVAAQVVIDLRKADDRKTLEQIENDLVARFHDHEIYRQFKFEDGLIVNFEQKGGTGHWRPLFTR